MIRPFSGLLALAAFGCVSDYGIEKTRPQDPAPPDTGRLPGVDTASVWPVSCVPPPLADSVPTDESCVYEPVYGPLDAVVEWTLPRWSNYGEYSQVVMAPLVAQLTDDNGDGSIDRHDIPDIVLVADDEGVHTHKKGILRILPGDGSSPGSALQRVDLDDAQIYPYRYSNLAIGDIDGDGQPEIVAVVLVVAGAFPGDDGGDDTAPPSTDGGSGDDGGGGDDGEDIPVSIEPGDGESRAAPATCYVAAFTVGGDVDWVAMDAPLPCGGHAPALADLDGDASVEVVVGDRVLNGRDGAVRWIGGQGHGAYATHPEVGYHSIPMDLDLDGRMEVLTGQTLYESDGAVRCGFEGAEEDGFAAAADLDLDGVGEVVSVGNGQVRVMESDCTVLASFRLVGGGNGGPPTIADFDADGIPEIGVADATTYAVYESDGTPLWSMPVQDASSHCTGSAVFDFEGDGRPEVVYADETRLWVFDGSTGEVRMSNDAHASRTLHEFPTVADVDGDGAVEIIVPNGGGHSSENRNGIMVLGHGDTPWASGRQLWNQHGYSITNILDDLSIPSGPSPNWPTWNTFRSGDVHPHSGNRSPDAVPVAEVCMDECDFGRVVVYVRLGNSGAGGLRYDLPISLYAEDVNGQRTLLRTDWVPDQVEVGQTSTMLRLVVESRFLENQRLVVVADDADGRGYVDECSETNNEVVIDDVTCF